MTKTTRRTNPRVRFGRRAPDLMVGGGVEGSEQLEVRHIPEIDWRIGGIPVKCDGYRILIREMLRGQLDIDEATLVASHMDVCQSCRSFHRGLTAANRESNEPAAGTADPVQATRATSRASGWSIAVAVVLVIASLVGLFLVARQAGWGRAGWLCRPGHGSSVHRRSP